MIYSVELKTKARMAKEFSKAGWNFTSKIKALDKISELQKKYRDYSGECVLTSNFLTIAQPKQ